MRARERKREREREKCLEAKKTKENENPKTLKRLRAFFILFFFINLWEGLG